MIRALAMFQACEDDANPRSPTTYKFIPQILQQKDLSSPKTLQLDKNKQVTSGMPVMPNLLK
jgi:hypothetical protein